MVTLYFLVQPVLAAHVGHLVLEEGEAVLTVPVVGLVLHPVEPGRVQMIIVIIVLIRNTDQVISYTNKHIPGDLSPVVIPGPVPVLVISVGAVHCRSNPPLVSVSGS